MKKIIFLLAVLALLVGCNSQETSTNVKINAGNVEVRETAEPELTANSKAIIAEVFVDPSEVSKCEGITNSKDKEICYSTFMAKKAESQESFDKEICDKVPTKRDDCILYLAAIEAQS